MFTKIIFLFHLVVCADGSCYKFHFDSHKGGECTRDNYDKFLKDQDEWEKQILYV